MRDLETAVETELSASVVRPFYLFKGEFVSSTIRLASTHENIQWDSVTWQGDGLFRGLSSLRESGNVEANGIEIVLDGVTEALLALVFDDAQQGKHGTIYLGFFDSSWNVIANPAVLFIGGYDYARINESINEPTLSLFYESNSLLLKKKNGSRYTNEEQKKKYAADVGFEFVNSLKDWKGFWGTNTDLPTKKKN